MTAPTDSRPRLLPDRPFPAYAYLPGRYPHPVRHPLGHSYQSAEPSTEGALDSEAFRWGIDLFNHGYYWEAHEAWEGLWQEAIDTPQHRLLYKGLILLAASGVKVREGKAQAARRHSARAVATLRKVSPASDAAFASALGMGVAELAAAASNPPAASALASEQRPVFGYLLGPSDAKSRGRSAA